jgi:hypothetical protein
MTTAIVVLGLVAWGEFVALLHLLEKYLTQRDLRKTWESAYKRECEFSDQWRRECFSLAGIDPKRTALP